MREKNTGGTRRFTRKKITSLSLRDKLIFLFAGAMFISMSLLGITMFVNVYNSTKESLSKNIATTVAALSDSLDQSFLVAENLVLELAASEGVQKWLDDGHYYDQENPEYYLRKTEFNSELQRLLIYSNAKKLNVVEYAAVFIGDSMLEYADIQSVGEGRIRSGAQKAYDELETDGDTYIYSQLVTEPENAIFHARRMKSYFDDGDQLIIMVATNERDIYKKYKHLLQNEGAVVYLVDEENRVLSSNMEKEIGQYLDKALVKGIENNSSEVELDGKYLIDSEYMEDSGMRLVHLYPKNMLATQVLEGIRPYVALCIGLIVVCLLSAVLIGLRTTRFLDEFVWAMNSVRRKNYDVKIRKYKDPEIDRLGEAFNQMTAEIKELIQNKYESQILLNEMEIRFLQHQMNPHFLFNVLLTIQIKAKRCKDETIYHMVSTLSSLLRASIYTNNIEMITVREELEYAEFYLYLQKMRFDDRISYEVVIEDDSLKECMIPKFVIEPIVENAVIHGIENTESQGRIKITLKKEGEILTAEVEDNGVGFDVEKYRLSMEAEKEEDGIRQSREKIGLRNVDLRIRHIYGEKYGIDIKSEINKGTVIRIRIPIKESDQNV
jgi:two-component system sensor histidine kinase YesM